MTEGRRRKTREERSDRERKRERQTARERLLAYYKRRAVNMSGTLILIEKKIHCTQTPSHKDTPLRQEEQEKRRDQISLFHKKGKSTDGLG